MTPNRSSALGPLLLALTLLLALPAASPLAAHARTSVETEAEEAVARTSVQEVAETVQEEATEEAHAEEEDGHGPAPPLFMVIPFAVLLLMIATGPLFYPHHWHHHYPKYAVGLGVLVMAYYLAVLHAPTPILHAIEEYLAFIALLASLYIASGGILIKTDFAGTPKANSAMLFVGSVISNVIGTTGASMLLIRPFMRLNQGRLKPYHIIFFIFTVSNVGGALTPIGDPPLFLG
ncbi:MAG: sodium:proton antiporter, partial [Rhodothermales bacterium]